MVIFGRKKERKDEVEEVVERLEKPSPAEKLEVVEEQVKEEGVEPERPSFAPLFIKLDRYKKILSELSGLRSTVITLKNSFAVLKELEDVKTEGIKMIQSALEKLDKKVVELDSEFIRPEGFKEELPEEYTPENLEGVLADIRNQVEQLKDELKSIT